MASGKPFVLPKLHFLHLKARDENPYALEDLWVIHTGVSWAPIKAAIIVISIIIPLLNLHGPEQTVREFRVLFNKAQLV